MIPSEVIKTILEESNAFDGWHIAGGSEPTKPDQCITCLDTGGQPSNPKWLLDFPSVQVVVRAPVNNYRDAYLKAKDVKDICLGIDARNVDGGRIDGITLAIDVLYIGKDDNNRHKFTVNFDLILEPEASILTHREAL